MAIFKCKNNFYISVTQEILKKINVLKKTKLGLARTYNHIKFLKKALKEEVTPVGFRRNLYLVGVNKKLIEKKIGLILMKDTLKGLYLKQKRLRDEEEKCRSQLMLRLRHDEWLVLQEKLLECEMNVFLDTRMRQIDKMKRLLEARDCERWHKDVKVLNNEDLKRGRVINLSKHELSNYEELLLLKGQDFAVSSNFTNFLDVSVNVEKVMKRLNLCDGVLPGEIMKVLGAKDRRVDNLSKHEREALDNLCKSKDLVITSSDKGKITLVLDKEEYDNKLNSIVLGGDYGVLKKDPTDSIDRKLRNIAARVKKNSDDIKMYYKLVGENTRWPSIFGNLKVHKRGIPMRVIIASYGTVLSNAGNFVKNILNDYVENWDSKNITLGIPHMKEEIREENLVFEGKCVLASLDVVNMFNNISVEKALEIIRKLVEGDNSFKEKYNLGKPDFIEIVELLLNNSYFKYGDQFFKQLFGMPMGSGISPAVADLVMLDLEESMKELAGFKFVKYYKRYRDDIFIIWRGSRGELKEFVEDLNILDTSGRLKFTIEEEDKNGSLPFLDAKITLEEGILRFSVFEKPYSARTYLNYNSYQDVGIKRAIIAGETLRYLRISDHQTEDLEDLETKLEENNYPSHVVKKVMKATSKKWDKQYYSSKGQNNTKKDGTYLSVNFPGKKKAKDLKKLGKKFGFKVAFKRSNTLGNKLSRNFKSKTNRNRGLIYLIKCRCGDEYVGETGKDLNYRIKRHKYSISIMDENNGLAVHTLNCDKGFDWENAACLGWEGNWQNRKIKESLWIQRINPKMNLNKGWKLKGKWN